jgi:hypothetical protein
MAAEDALIDAAFLGDLDEIRGIPADLGKRAYSVTVRVNAWTGGRPGSQGSSKVTTDTPLLVNGNRSNPKVVQADSDDAIASGGLYTNEDLTVGPLTPAYAASFDRQSAGVAYDTLDPAVLGNTVDEIFFLVKGPGMPPGGAWFERVSEDSTSTTRTFITLKRSANQSP